MCVLQGGVPLATLTGQTQGPQTLKTLPHSMDVGNVQIGVLGMRVVCHVLCALPLCHVTSCDVILGHILSWHII